MQLVFSFYFILSTLYLSKFYILIFSIILSFALLDLGFSLISCGEAVMGFFVKTMPRSLLSFPQAVAERRRKRFIRIVPGRESSVLLLESEV